MSKILIFANNDIGLYKFRKELIQELINQKNRIYISLPYGDMVQPLINMGCIFIDTDVNRRGINPITDLKLLLQYYQIIMKNKPDLVITYTIKPNIYGGLVCSFCKVIYAVNITGLGSAFHRKGFLKKLVIFLYKISCKKAKVVFFENQENQQIFLSNKIVKKENTCKLNGAGVNIEEYQFNDYPEDNGKIRFLFIGRVMKEKGVDELIKVAKKIKNEFENVIIDIVGPLEDNYRYIIDELQEQNIINYYGYQTDVKPFIQSAHCFVLPSYHEGMANTLLECGAMGRPLITSNICGCKEAVIDRESGYLIKVNDYEDLYNKMIEFIEMPYAAKIKMGYSSFKHIISMFDKRKIVEITLREIIK